MVIELSGVQFDLKSYAWFEITSMVCSPKLHDTNFNYHFITSILKSHSLIPQIQDFSQYLDFIDPVAGLQKSVTGNAFKSHFVCKTERLFLQFD